MCDPGGVEADDVGRVVDGALVLNVVMEHEREPTFGREMVRSRCTHCGLLIDEGDVLVRCADCSTPLDSVVFHARCMPVCGADDEAVLRDSSAMLGIELDADLLKPSATARAADDHAGHTMTAEVVLPNAVWDASSAGMSVGELLIRGAATFAHRVQFRAQDGRLWRVWQSMSAAARIALRLRAAAAAAGVCGDGRRPRVAMVGPNCVEWALAFFATQLADMTAVLLPPSLVADASHLRHALSSADVWALVVHRSLRSAAHDVLADLPTVRQVVVIADDGDGDGEDEDEDEDVETLATMAAGASSDDIRRAAEQLAPFDAVAPATMVFTSGSTGRPKGVVQPAASWQFLCRRWHGRSAFVETRLALTPMHSQARRLAAALMAGNTTAILALQQTNDWAAAVQRIRPTHVNLVPWIWRNLYDRAAELRAAGAEGAAATAAVAALLGDRVHEVSTRSAPIAPEVWAWVRAALPDVASREVYGATEVGGIAFDGRFLSTVDAILVDCPDAGYLLTDLPHPRGELCVATMAMAAGYVGLERPQNSWFERDGKRYFHTGDIVERLPDGSIRIVDRIASVVKVASGEFVPVGAVETALWTATGVRQLAVMVDSRRRFTVSVVVPDADALTALAEAPTSVTGDPAELLRDALTRHAVATGSGEVIRHVPRAVVLADEPFTASNGLLTSTLKINRRAVAARYADAIDAAFAATDNASAVARVPPLDGLLDAQSPLAAGTLLTSLGVDSFSVAVFAQQLADRHDVDIGVDRLLRATVGDLRRMVSERSTAVVAAAPAVDWAAEMHLPDDIVPAAAAAVAAADRPPRVWLVTGAAGLVGSHMVAAVLAAWPDARVICHARASSSGDAGARVLSAARRFGWWREALAARVEVLSGDLAAPRIGLSSEQAARLAATADVVVACGARVSHVADYAEHRPANVVGLHAMLRLAAGGPRRSRFALVSSVASLSGDGMRDSDESTPLPPPADAGTMRGGYAQSKRVGEALILAARRRGLRATVFRVGAVFGATTTGACNAGDHVVRMLRTMTALRQCPDLETPRDVVPVDYLAAAMVALTAADDGRGDAVFHLTYLCKPPMTLAAMGSALGATGVDYATWVDLVSAAGHAVPLAPLRHLLAGGDRPPRVYPSDATLAALRQLGLDPPAITPHYVRQALRWVDQDVMSPRVPA